MWMFLAKVYPIIKPPGCYSVNVLINKHIDKLSPCRSFFNIKNKTTHSMQKGWFYDAHS